MKTYIIIICIILSGYIYPFFNHKVSVRPGGMGNAFVAVANDINSFDYNVAGIKDVKNISLHASYQNLLPYLGENISYNNFRFVYPDFEYLTAGIMIKWFNTSLYDEITYALGIAGRPLFIENMNVGLLIKLLEKHVLGNEYTVLDPILKNKDHAFNVTFDVGLKYSWNDNIVSGLACKNITQPNLAYDNSITEKVPITFVIGNGYITDNLIIDCDIEIQNEIINDVLLWNILLGAEYVLPNINMKIRLGSDRYKGSVGIGYKIKNITFDYAYDYHYLIKSILGSHKFALTFDW